MTSNEITRQRLTRMRRTPGIALRVVAMAVLFSSPIWAYALLLIPYDEASVPAKIVGVALFILAVLIPLAFLSAREPFLREVVIVGLFFKVATTATFLFMGYVIYDGAADMIIYYRIGRYIADVYNSTGQLQFAQPAWFGVQFIYNVTGLLFILVGSSVVVGAVCFSLLAFVGQYLMYRAFAIAYPEGDRRMAAVLLFLLPSIVYWTSAIGKDALAVFFIGSAVYGFALLERRSRSSAFLPLLFGLAGLLCVRPHVAGMLATAFALPYAVGRNKQGVRGLVVKAIGIPILIGVTVYFAAQAQAYVGMDDVSQASYVLSKEATGSKIGSSAFGSASVTARVLGAPFLFFRPFPWEVHNLQALIACAESMLLLAITWRLRKQIYYALWKHWRSGFTLFLILYLVEFSVVFSACISNFGLLARERTMAVPLFVILLCMIPPRLVEQPVRTPLSRAHLEPRRVPVPRPFPPPVGKL